MRDPRKDGHEPLACCENGCEESCAHESHDDAHEYWPCSVVREYDEWLRNKPKTAVPELRTKVEELAAQVDELKRQNKGLEAQLRNHEKFFAGAVMPVIRDLLATHATGSLSVPAIINSIDGVRADAFKGIGVNFKATGVGYVYESTDKRVYTDGAVTRGASATAVYEQLKRFNDVRFK